MNQSRDPFVLSGYAHREIDNENTHIGAANAALCAHHAEHLHRTRMFATAADSRGIDENELSAIALVKNVNGIARRSRQLAHDRALSAHNGIDERGFTDIWPANDRHCK